MINFGDIQADFHVRLFNSDSVEEAEIYLIAEAHKDTACQALKGKVVSLIANRGPILLFVEGITSMKPLMTDKRTLKDMACIETTVKDENVEFYGWDMDDEELLQKGSRVCLLQTKADSLKEDIDKLSSSIQTVENGIRQRVPNFLDETFDPAPMFALAQDDLTNIMKNVELLTGMEKDKLALHKQLDLLHAEIIKEREILSNDFFPRRTEAMVKTIQKIYELKHPQKVILIAGLSHLKTLSINEGNPAYDLSPLYRELQRHKACILLPKMLPS